MMEYLFETLCSIFFLLTGYGIAWSITEFMKILEEEKEKDED